MSTEEEGRPAVASGTGVGARVAALRVERSLSQSRLARLAGVGKATLSGLEAGNRNPTLDTLHAVAAALGVPITALVSPEPVLLRGVAVEVTVLQVFDDDAVTYELCHLRVPAGAAQRSPAHPAGTTEHVTVFTGVLEAGPVGATVRAEAGEHLSWPADTPHVYAAVGEGAVEASLLIRTPRV